MRRTRGRRGAALVSTTLAGSLGLIVLAAGVRMVQTTGDLARFADAGDTASRRTETALEAFEDAIRSVSVAQVTRVDGTPFVSGTFDDGISGKRVIGFRGAPVLGARFRIWWAPDATGTRGDVLRMQSGVTEVVARGVERFRVSRSGNAFTVSVTSHAGTRGTWERTVRGSSTLLPRNP